MIQYNIAIKNTGLFSTEETIDTIVLLSRVPIFISKINLKHSRLFTNATRNNITKFINNVSI